MTLKRTVFLILLWLLLGTVSFVDQSTTPYAVLPIISAEETGDYDVDNAQMRFPSGTKVVCLSNEHLCKTQRNDISQKALAAPFAARYQLFSVYRL